MQRVFRRFLFWTFILSACSSGGFAPQPVPPTITDTAVASPVTTIPNPQNCGYQWANQDLPKLSSSFQAAIQVLQPEAEAKAFAFGENCMLADGSLGSFSAMETDFNVTLQVSDLTNESDLGEWVVKVMQVIENIPKDQLLGPQPGRVSIGFESNGAQKFINFYINQYQALPAGLRNSEIFRALQRPS